MFSGGMRLRDVLATSPFSIEANLEPNEYRPEGAVSLCQMHWLLPSIRAYPIFGSSSQLLVVVVRHARVEEGGFELEL